MAKAKEINWNDGIIDLMPEEKLNIFIKKFEKAILEEKQTPEGRRRLAKSFGKKPSDFKV